MKTRPVTIYTGKVFKCPQHIQRIDHKATHGWQLRYGGTKLYSDGKGSPATSLRLATEELKRRIARLPAPNRLQLAPSANKTSALPVGISGPIIRRRAGAKARECNLLVSLPIFGQNPRRSTIYIGNENTYTEARFMAALARAVLMRNKAEAVYRKAATAAKRTA